MGIAPNPIVDIRLPVIIPGECVVVIPEVSFDMPEIPGSPLALPEEFGIRGFSICVDEVDMALGFFGTDFIPVLSGIIIFLSMAMVWREIRS
jgi:hypothetical protein